MNGAHLHLLINHLPVLGLLFGLVLLGVGLLGRQRILKIAALFSIMLAAVSTPVTNFTGKEAAKVVEKMGRSQAIIYEHEEAAELALWLMLVLGAMAAGAFYLLHKSHPRAHLLTTATLGLGVLVFIWMAQVANLGGQISHPEIRPGFTQDRDQ